MKEKNTHNDHEVRITRLEVVVENINTTLVDIKRSIERIDTKIDSNFSSLNNKGDNNFSTLNNKIDCFHSELSKKIDTERAWLIGIGFTTLLSFFGTVVMIIMKLHV